MPGHVWCRSRRIVDVARGGWILTLIVAWALPAHAVEAEIRDVPRRDVLAGVETARLAHSFVVVVDAGHGGKDQGTAGAGVALEKDVVLGISRAVAAHLESHERVQVILTRDDDTFVPLEERVRIARESQADLFVSIHANAAPNPRARGAEVYFLSLDGASDEQAAASEDRENAAFLVGGEHAGSADDAVLDILLDLRGTQALQRSAVCAELVLDRLRADGVGASRSVRQANFAVLRTLSMPSVLVEAGFLSHRDEARFLASEEGQGRIGWSLARAVVEYFDTTEAAGSLSDLPSLHVHTVERGDTLWKLAARGGWSVERLRRVNALRGDALVVGQRLLVP